MKIFDWTKDSKRSGILLNEIVLLSFKKKLKRRHINFKISLLPQHQILLKYLCIFNYFESVTKLFSILKKAIFHVFIFDVSFLQFFLPHKISGSCAVER